MRSDFALGFSGLARVLRRLDRPAEAEACYEKALSLNPGDKIAHYNLASLLLIIGSLVSQHLLECWSQNGVGNPLASRPLEP
jgi:tetratricopeptide (TPR) repeat protein